MRVGSCPGLLKGDSKSWQCRLRTGRGARRKQAAFLTGSALPGLRGSQQGHIGLFLGVGREGGADLGL